ncbi:MAG: polysaccharide deacetylase family protein [Sterolibacterium sp.]|nr:polysaccharide deacetylase family protein [Sterolibacterium sp.]
MKLALKIDVNTWRGTLQGVPRLVEALQRHQAEASFFLSLGADRSGRAPKQLPHPAGSSRLAHYGIKTLLYGTLLPAPDISRSCSEILRNLRDAGFEVGVQCWDRMRWQNEAERAEHTDSLWAEREMQLACARFEEIFETPAKAHAAAGWQSNAQALRLTQHMGFDYACDTRGSHPYMPIYRGEVIHCPQLPTTLPPLDELIGFDGLTADNVHEHLLELSRDPPPSGHVFTLRAELEGMKLLPILEKLLSGWCAQGYTLTTTRAIFASLDSATLPRHEIVRGQLAGQDKTLMLQGEAFLDAWHSAAA